MTKRRVGCLLILVMIGGTIITYEVVLPWTNPLRRSNEKIAATLLQKTPLGSTMVEVRAVLDREGSRHWEPDYDPPDQVTIQSTLGRYTDYFGLVVLVTVEWVFDKKDLRLQRIKVRHLAINML
jgi:hypothetical protein